ncbi:hypothetical protein VTK73DRAFT_994 [Phialemonium thermophilum]|uniref:Uncharacterized protein n=1 Tax=Phialemonium thermophilum TaxID=223376 RepID=A0ABR3VU69_9PEZI
MDLRFLVLQDVRFVADHDVGRFRQEPCRLRVRRPHLGEHGIADDENATFPGPFLDGVMALVLGERRPDAEQGPQDRFSRLVRGRPHKELVHPVVHQARGTQYQRLGFLQFVRDLRGHREVVGLRRLRDGDQERDDLHGLPQSHGMREQAALTGVRLRDDLVPHEADAGDLVRFDAARNVGVDVDEALIVLLCLVDDEPCLVLQFGRRQGQLPAQHASALLVFLPQPSVRLSKVFGRPVPEDLPRAPSSGGR